MGFCTLIGVRLRGEVCRGLALLFALLALSPALRAADKARDQAILLVQQIQRADYEGDRATLERLHNDLARYTLRKDLAAHVQYWRGFALWRRALNGFNDNADPKELESDLNLAIVDFEEALSADPRFADAMAAKASCLANLAFLSFKADSPNRGTELLRQSSVALKNALAAGPENPRCLWVRGANEWYTPPEKGGGQAVALTTYQRGLDLAQEQKGREKDPLAPSWGEPELLMTLAFANLNRKPPQLAAAERYAQQALVEVPHWHYVRDILIPQIHAAQAKAQP